MKITKDITIEELIEEVPQSVKYLMNQGIKCIACGEPIWGTLEEAAREKEFSDEEIEQFVKELQYYTDHPEKDIETTDPKINIKKI